MDRRIFHPLQGPAPRRSRNEKSVSPRAAPSLFHSFLKPVFICHGALPPATGEPLQARCAASPRPPSSADRRTARPLPDQAPPPLQTGKKKTPPANTEPPLSRRFFPLLPIGQGLRRV